MTRRSTWSLVRECVGFTLAIYGAGIGAGLLGLSYRAATTGATLALPVPHALALAAGLLWLSGIGFAVCLYEVHHP